MSVSSLDSSLHAVLPALRQQIAAASCEAILAFLVREEFDLETLLDDIDDPQSNIREELVPPCKAHELDKLALVARSPQVTAAACSPSSGSTKGGGGTPDAMRAVTMHVSTATGPTATQMLLFAGVAAYVKSQHAETPLERVVDAVIKVMAPQLPHDGQVQVQRRSEDFYEELCCAPRALTPASVILDDPRHFQEYTLAFWRFSTSFTVPFHLDIVFIPAEVAARGESASAGGPAQPAAPADQLGDVPKRLRRPQPLLRLRKSASLWEKVRYLLQMKGIMDKHLNPKRDPTFWRAKRVLAVVDRRFTDAMDGIWVDVAPMPLADDEARLAHTMTRCLRPPRPHDASYGGSARDGRALILSAHVHAPLEQRWWLMYSGGALRVFEDAFAPSGVLGRWFAAPAEAARWYNDEQWRLLCEHEEFGFELRPLDKRFEEAAGRASQLALEPKC